MISKYPESTEKYLLKDSHTKYFYAYNISRKTSGENGFTIPGPGPKAYGIELNQPIFIIFRIYLEQSTKTGPVIEEILLDGASPFTKSSMI